MTNEELVKRYDGTNDAILVKLYNKNEAFIKFAAKQVAGKYHCLRLRENGRGYSRYTMEILEELKNEGTLEFFDCSGRGITIAARES